MKKILLPIIITGLFSTSAFALAPASETSNVDWTQVFSEIQESAATVPGGAEKNPDDKSKKGLKRTIFKRVVQYKTAKFVFRNPGKTLIAGAAVGGLGYYGYYKMKKELFKQKMAKHELFEQEWQNMIDYYPDEWEALLKRVDHDIEHSDDEEHVENLEKFLDFVAVSAKTEEAAKEIREALNSNSKHIVDSVEAMFNEVEEEFNKTGKKCTVDDLKKLIDRNYDFSSYSEKINKKNNGQFSVSSYLDLKGSKFVNGFDLDHIPSYKAIENFIIQKGISLKLELDDDKGGSFVEKTKNHFVKGVKKLKTKRLLILENNTTTIAVNNQLHLNGRTYYGRNTHIHLKDSYNLKLATINDISFALYYLQKHNQMMNFQEYLKNSRILIKRNFELCLYQ